MVIPRRQHELNRVPQSIHNPPLVRPIALSAALLSPLALSWALMQVESMLRFSISASADNAPNTASDVPSSRRLANWAYTDCHGPYTSGSFLHCAPLRAIQRTPLSIFLSSFRGRPRCPVLSGGSIAFTRSHCSFVNSYRFMYLFSHLRTTCAIFVF